jgi:hypothetical protein
MAPCIHQQWLRAHRDDNGFVLEYGNRLSNITNSLPHPATQYPTLIFFIGTQAKSRALRALFPGNSISNRRKYGVANICVDPTTTEDNYPVLIADSTPDFAQTNPRGKVVCHETISYPVAWPDEESGLPTQQGLVDYLHARLLSLFINVICIFAQDCGGLDGVAARLASWTTLGSASSLPNNTRPRLLIVTSIPGPTFDSEALRFRLGVLADPKFADSFSSLILVNILGSDRRSSRTLFSSLGEVLGHEADTARLERVNTHTLFSVVHITALFESALRNFAISPRHTFNFIKSSREENPVSPAFGKHIKSFMSLSLEHKLPNNILWNFIGSAIVMDGFPPDMHCK